MPIRRTCICCTEDCCRVRISVRLRKLKIHSQMQNSHLTVREDDSWAGAKGRGRPLEARVWSTPKLLHSSVDCQPQWNFS